MKEQNFKNHGRYVFMWHILTGLAIIAVVIGSIINLANSAKDNLYSAMVLRLFIKIRSTSLHNYFSAGYPGTISNASRPL